MGAQRSKGLIPEIGRKPSLDLNCLRYAKSPFLGRLRRTMPEVPPTSKNREREGDGPRIYSYPRALNLSIRQHRRAQLGDAKLGFG
jgi:hypothetical protein